MKKIQKKVLSLVCVFGVFSTVFSNAAGYLGSVPVAYAADAITISTAQELQKIGNNDAYPLSGDYVLGADIDMSGIDFTPIGGGAGTRGAASGDNVFTGTFDGAGHVISNLTIQESGSSEKDWQYGLFGMIGSEDSNDVASVKNLILSGVDISVDMSGNGYLSLGVLAGEVNRNAVIDNIAIIDGQIEANPSNGGDVVGAGGLVGEMRPEIKNGEQLTNNGVTVSNVYIGADVVSGSSTNTNYAAGIVGRIAKADIQSMTACVYTGNATFKGLNGYGISGGDKTGNITNCYYVSGENGTGTVISENDLKTDKLLEGLSEEYWTTGTNNAVQLKLCAESQTLSEILAWSALSFTLGEGDVMSAVTGDFTVPDSITFDGNTEKISWTSDVQESVLSIDADGHVTVNTEEIYADMRCVLTATTESQKTWNFPITIKSANTVAVKIKQEYAVIGEPLTAVMVDEPEDMTCTYTWSIDGIVKSQESSYTPVSDDLEKMLTLTATATNAAYDGAVYTTQMYISKLPVVYVNTENNAEIVSKEDYLNGYLKIQGNAEYNSENTTLYDGIMEIRGRGNTTWSHPKKPYKMKLDEKTDIFGFGANKHWVLLANYTDEAHMRNKLAYDLSGEMGMPYMQSVHVDLILNGEYKGTYQFCEQVKISKARVNIHDWEDYAEDVAKAIYKAHKDDAENPLTKNDRDAMEEMLAETDMRWISARTFTYTSEAGVTKTYAVDDYDEENEDLDPMPNGNGGFLIELDAYYDEVSKFYSSKGQPLMYKSPEFINTDAVTMTYAEDYVNAFEKAMDASDFTTAYNGENVSYSQLFDMDSLVQFWLVQELFFNVDAMKKSTYMYKDSDEKFYMGPIWDMDWSSDSLVSYSQGSGTYNTWQTTKFSDSAQAKQWYKSIIKDPYFAVKAYELYKDMRDEMESMVADGGKIDTYQELLKESANANTDLWYSGDGQKKFATQTARLKTYLTNRLSWLDSQFTSPEALAKSLGYASLGGITVDTADITAKLTDTVAITANVTNASVKSAEFMVNGIKAGTVEVTDGKAVIDVPVRLLAGEKTLNTIQVYGLNTSGSVITSGNSKVTDFATFYADILPESGDTGENDDNTPDDGNQNGNGNTSGNGGNQNTDGKPSEEDKNNGGDNTAGDNNNITNGGSDNNTNNSTGNNDTALEVKTPEVKLNVTSVPMQKKQKTTAIKIVSKYPKDDTVASWKSSAPGIASVNQKGKITAKKVGKAVITVTMKSGAKASCTIKVQKGKVKTKKIALDKKKLTLKKGKTTQIVLNRVPVTANDKVTYSVKNKKIVKVSSKGKIKGLKKGTTKVTVKAGNKKVQLTVKVK